MQMTMQYCTGCLTKIVGAQPMLRQGGMAFFFLPVMDSYQRAFYAYVTMTVAALEDITSRKEHQVMNLLPLLEILHVEEGWWPEPQRQQEIQQFYAPATHHTLHNVKVAA